MNDPAGADPTVRPRDACGVAGVAHLSGEARRDVVARALQALANLAHRGAEGADTATGDGAGILTAVPDAFLRAACDVDLPPPGRYGVAMCFLPTDADARASVEESLAGHAAHAGLRLLTWRDVPVDPRACGDRARRMAPVIRQAVLGLPDGLDADDAERALYLMRRRVERALPDGAAIVSCSARTLVYKGMMTAAQLPRYYADLADARFASPVALVHLRFSTNTLPRWELAHPFRMLAHNGEINTLDGNRGWMRARQATLASPLFGDDLADALPVIVEGQSDSAMLDNALELLVLGGRSLPHAAMMLLPEAHDGRDDLSPELVDCYRYHACLQEPWDGPAWITFCDGRTLGATLDRNGLRPGRWLTTDDGWVVLSSEAGVLPIPDDRVTRRGRLRPGKLFVVDVAAGTVSADGAAEQRVAERRPYGEWMRTHQRTVDDLPIGAVPPPAAALRAAQLAFGWTVEDVDELVVPLARDGKEPNGSMGDDTALAVLNDGAPTLCAYLKQRFAQVTNPAIDPLREDIVMSTESLLGARGNWLDERPEAARLLRLDGPVVDDVGLARLWAGDGDIVRPVVLDATWPRRAGAAGLSVALDALTARAAEAVADGATVLIVSDRATDRDRVPVPALLAVAAVHHHLTRAGRRWQAALVVDSAEPREVHHLACLVGYGAAAVHPRLLLRTVRALLDDGLDALDGLDRAAADAQVTAGLHAGLRKIMSKMGISTLSSYSGAQVFEAVGLDYDLVARYLTGTPSQVGGVTVDVLGAEALARHARAWPMAVTPAEPNREGAGRPAAGASGLASVDDGRGDATVVDAIGRTDGLPPLPLGGRYRWRRDGERHQWSPATVTALQRATLHGGDGEDFAAFSDLADAAARDTTVRGQLTVRTAEAPLDLDDVEPAADIVARFATGAMSLGSLSPEAHETLAVAMNRLGGRSNTGEGGESRDRAAPDPDGDSRRSAIKQVASARFGVDIGYLANADELQIKVAQGSKPGEGGQLPGHKVDDHIAELRFATPGVELISPPPHHDIYSIEDLKQLIYDLRTANPVAEVSVKLVAEAGVGTIAAGVAKAGADRIVIAGHSGGTGSSPLSSIKSAGLPWELGLAETQRVLVDNDLRGHVRLQADGQMKTARDVIVAGLLGAEEVAFSTAPLIAAGCIMMRVCHLNTCPVGIATQDPRLRARFAGLPEHVVTYFTHLAAVIREWLARMALPTFDDLVGRVDLLAPRPDRAARAARLDLTGLLAHPGGVHRDEPSDADGPVPPRGPRRRVAAPLASCDPTVDARLIDAAGAALTAGAPVRLEAVVTNRDRAVGGRLSHAVVTGHGPDGLPDGAVGVHLTGSAGQSFGAWLAGGVTLTLEGEANDYVGKGLSGGVVAVRPPPGHRTHAEQVIAGNVCLYGATRGRAFLRGAVGERFAIRNSGAQAVVEGVGDHGCEYMTGGTVVVLGPTGRNFAAGMSGGVAYVLDLDGGFAGRCNTALVDLRRPTADDLAHVRELVVEHSQRTGSTVAAGLLDDWAAAARAFVQVMPVEYARVHGLAGDRVHPRLPSAAGNGAAVAEVVHG